MFKFLGRHGEDGRVLVGLALSEADVEQLRCGGALTIEVADMGADLRAPGSKSGAGSLLLFFAEEAAVERRMRALDLAVPPALLPKPPRFRALPGKGPRRRSAAASVGRRRSRTGT
jgi:hypothetical protein